MTTILYINNHGGGFAGNTDVPDGMTIGELFAAKMGLEDPKNYAIKVNGQVTASTQTLRTGDKVVVTPDKMEGA